MYWVSTPRFTILVEVDGAGVIHHTAPYMKRQWLGQQWATIQAQLAIKWGTTLGVHALPQGG